MVCLFLYKNIYDDCLKIKKSIVESDLNPELLNEARKKLNMEHEENYKKIKNYSESNIKDKNLDYENNTLKKLLKKYQIKYKKIVILNMPLQDPKA